MVVATFDGYKSFKVFLFNFLVFPDRLIGVLSYHVNVFLKNISTKTVWSTQRNKMSVMPSYINNI